MTRNNHAILGVRKDATIDEIKTAYRRQARQVHPDRFPNDPQAQKLATESFRLLTDAYQTLRTHAPIRRVETMSAATTTHHVAGFAPAYFPSVSPTEGTLIDARF